MALEIQSPSTDTNGKTNATTMDCDQQHNNDEGGAGDGDEIIIMISSNNNNNNNNNNASNTGIGNKLVLLFNPNDSTTTKQIPCHLFHTDNRVTRKEAIYFNHHCKSGVKLSGNRTHECKKMLKEIIIRVREQFDGELRAMIEDAIRKQCSKRNITYQGNPITKMDQLARVWAADITIKETLWQCCFGSFEINWESDFEEQAMKKLNYEYLEDEQSQREGSTRRGNKGCVAKLARNVKQEVMKAINQRVGKTHKTILVAGTAPEIIGEYENGKKKYGKRPGTSDFNFN